MRRTNGFYQAVMDEMPGIRVSKSTISMVKAGKRRNDAVLMAIITAEHKILHDGNGGLINKKYYYKVKDLV